MERNAATNRVAADAPSSTDAKENTGTRARDMAVPNAVFSGRAGRGGWLKRTMSPPVRCNTQLGLRTTRLARFLPGKAAGCEKSQLLLRGNVLRDDPARSVRETGWNRDAEGRFQCALERARFDVARNARPYESSG